MYLQEVEVVDIQTNHVHVHACVLVFIVLVRNSTLCLPTSLVFIFNSVLYCKCAWKPL